MMKQVLLVLVLVAVAAAHFDLEEDSEKLFDKFLMKHNRAYDPKKSIKTASTAAKQQQPTSKFASMIHNVKSDIKGAVDWTNKKMESGFSGFKNDLKKLEEWVKKEYNNRKAIFKKNIDKIKQLNKKGKGVTYGVTQFTDMDPAEFKKVFTTPTLSKAQAAPKHYISLSAAANKNKKNNKKNNKKSKPKPKPKPQPDDNNEDNNNNNNNNNNDNNNDNDNKDHKIVQPDVITPNNNQDNTVEQTNVFDWRAKGAVTSVKSQGQCGCCWTFAAAGVVEGQYFKSKGQLTDIASQNWVDCDKTCKYGVCSNGCNGGIPLWALEYSNKNGIAMLKDYPFKATAHKCAATGKNLVKVAKSFDVAADEDQMLTALETYGPLSMCFHVTDGFQFYKGGVYSDASCPKQINHAVLIVGHGEENGKKYWIVKNSWDQYWGEKGYFRIERGTNMCGLNSQVAGADGIL